MAKKRLVLNEPKFGMTGSYNFPNGYDVGLPVYEDSLGLPKNNDKFQKKDLYSTAVGDEINAAIVDRNLKYQAGTSYIRIDSVYVHDNAGDDKNSDNNRIWIWMFSEKAFEDKDVNFNSDGYTNMHYYIYNQSWCQIFDATTSEIKDGKNWGTVLEDQDILTNLNESVIDIEDFTDNHAGTYYTPSAMDTRDTTIHTQVIDENVYNPIYFVVRLRGDESSGWGRDKRKRRYEVFRINNLDLFDYDDAGNATGKITVFDDVNVMANVNAREGEGGGAGDEKAQWHIKEGNFRVTINTIGSTINDWDDEDDVKKYEKYFGDVDPIAPFYRNDLNSFLNISPYSQLFNDFNSGEKQFGNSVYRDYDPLTTISVLPQGEFLTGAEVDLQSYYEDNEELSLQGSAPATVTFRLRTVHKVFPDDNYYYDIDVERDYFYFIIDWDDKDDKIKTLLDWHESRPTEVMDLLELQDNNLYKIYRKEVNEPGIIYTSYGEDDNNTLWPNPYELFPDELPFEFIDDNNGGISDSTPQFLHNSFESFERGEPTGDKACQILGHTGVTSGSYNDPVPYNPEDISGLVQWNGEEWVQNQNAGEYLYSRLDCYDLPTGTIPSHTYSTPGIKTIKAVMFSWDYPWPESTGRWKLITSRIYLDIPINQYPDFGELGGSDYVTLPWPHTTPIIGGVSEDSNYKISVRNTLSGGKIGDTDIIDEKFLVNDIENDEMGQSIRKMDLEQVRFFNTGSYSMHSLLNIEPASQIFYDEQYKEESYLNTLPFPQYFEEFDTDNDGLLEVQDHVFWVNYARPDIATELLRLKNEIDEWEALDEEDQPPFEDIIPSLPPTGDTEDIITHPTFDDPSWDTGNIQYILWQASNQEWDDVNPVISNIVEGWNLVNIGPDGDSDNQMVLNHSDNSIELFSFESNNLYIVTKSDVQVVKGRTYQVLIEISEATQMTFVPYQPGILETLGGANQVQLQDGFNEFEWTPTWTDDDLSKQIVIRRGPWGANNYQSFRIGQVHILADIYPEIDLDQYINSEYFESATSDFVSYDNTSFWDGDVNKFPEESSVGQIFISDNQDEDLKQNCKLELNTGELSNKSISDTSGNSNKGLLIGDYKVKKNRKGEPMRRDSFLKVPKKESNRDGAL